MNTNASERKHWSDRLLDGVTVLVALAAVAVAGDRFLRPALAGADTGDRPEIASVEAKLTGHAPGAVELVADGAREGRAVSFAAARPQLVVLFRTTCPACQATKPTWEELSASLPDGERAHAITVEPAGTRQAFFTSPRVQVWHATQPDRHAQAYPSPYVPTTLVVGTDGTVQYAKVGVLSRGDVDTIMRLLGR